MAWQTPKTNWQANDALTPTAFNRIEGNIQHLQDTKETPAGAQAKVDTHAGSKQTHGISGSYYIAKTSRSDQLPAWNDIQGKPSLVTSSDLSNALAAKIDKPASAVSGNIAVFDGGAGKLKDSDTKISDLLSVSTYYISPGNTVIAESLEETHGASWGRQRRNFLLSKPGFYRVTGELKTVAGNTVWAYVGVALNIEQTLSTDVLRISDEFSTNSTSYVSFTIDTTIPYFPGLVLVLICTGASNVVQSYLRNVRVRGVPATGHLPPVLDMYMPKR